MALKSLLSRRTLLRGVGASVALPLLDAMIPAMTAQAKTVAAAERLRRLSYIYMPMGFNPTEWTPSGETLDQLPPSLQALQPVKEQVTVISGMELRNA